MESRTDDDIMLKSFMLKYWSSRIPCTYTDKGQLGDSDEGILSFTPSKEHLYSFFSQQQDNGKWPLELAFEKTLRIFISAVKTMLNADFSWEQILQYCPGNESPRENFEQFMQDLLSSPREKTIPYEIKEENEGKLFCINPRDIISLTTTRDKEKKLPLERAYEKKNMHQCLRILQIMSKTNSWESILLLVP